MADEMAKVIEELARVKNVGPARAEQIYKELQISTLDELIKAAAAHRLQSLSGIGEKTEASILQSAQRQVKEAQPQPQPDAAAEVLTEQDFISAPDAEHDVEILSEDEFFQDAPEELTAASAEVLAIREELANIEVAAALPSGALRELSLVEDALDALGQAAAAPAKPVEPAPLAQPKAVLKKALARKLRAKVANEANEALEDEAASISAAPSTSEAPSSSADLEPEKTGTGTALDPAVEPAPPTADELPSEPAQEEPSHEVTTSSADDDLYDPLVEAAESLVSRPTEPSLAEEVEPSKPEALPISLDESSTPQAVPHEQPEARVDEEVAQVIADEPPVNEPPVDEASSVDEIIDEPPYEQSEAPLNTATYEEAQDESVDVAVPIDSPPSPTVTAEARFLGSLICPNCGHDELAARGRALVCVACRREYDRVAGVTQLAPPNRAYDVGLAQRVMETQLYARLYEQVMRPKLTRLVTERTLPQEYILAAEYLDLSPGVRLLDVACGTGNFTRHFADVLRELGAGDDPSLIVGLDMSEPMLDKAAEYLKASEMVDEIFLVRGDATRLPFQRGAFDRVHCAGALHMMEDPDEALRHFARVLRPDGLLVIGTFVEGSGLMRRALKRAAALPTHFRWFNPQDLRMRLERAGFEVQAQSKAQDALTLLSRRV